MKTNTYLIAASIAATLFASASVAAPAQRNVPSVPQKAIENATRAGINLQDTVMSDAGGGNGKEQVSTQLAPDTQTTTSTVSGAPIIIYGELTVGDDWIHSTPIATGPLYYTDISGNNASGTPPANGNFKKMNDVTYLVTTEGGDTTQAVTTQQTEVTETHIVVTQTTTYEEIDPGKSQPVNQAKEEAADPDSTETLSDTTTTSDPTPVGEPETTTVVVEEGETTTEEVTEPVVVDVCNNGNDYCNE